MGKPATDIVVCETWVGAAVDSSPLQEVFQKCPWPGPLRERPAELRLQIEKPYHFWFPLLFFLLPLLISRIPF